jgi:hypothetical protein
VARPRPEADWVSELAGEVIAEADRRSPGKAVVVGPRLPALLLAAGPERIRKLLAG